MSAPTIEKRKLERITGDRFAQTTELSQRETQIIYLVAQGYTNAAIAAVLFLAEDTIKTHLRRVFAKLGAADRAEAVTQSFHRGVLWSVGGALAVRLPAGAIPVVKS